MHYLVKKAYDGLYPEKESSFEAKIMYSKAFKGYNAKVKYTKSFMEFRLSYSWKEISDEIKIGLLQSLLNKIYTTNIKTIDIELYEIFVKKVPGYTPVTKTDEILEESFKRVNEIYFEGLITLPNVEFGGSNFRTLGTYDYGTDTIRISDVLRKDLVLLDYVMYHEMLHKKFRYKSTGKRTVHHSKEFREWERRFHELDVENKLKSFLRREQLKDKFWFM
jgi:predicted metal-dependent hydrolase